jgi:TolB-like protein/DNA-binding winged helix-turn-helix (wHTH) protein
MSTPSPSLPAIHFDGFELNPRTGELVRDGERVQLQEAPLRVLLTLLERPGELVTREELTSQLWPAGTFVDFERGLNKAVNKLRDALGDSAELPKFIETLPRKGYRFIGRIEPDSRHASKPDNLIPMPVRPRTHSRPRRHYVVFAAGGVALIVGILLGIKIAGGHRDSNAGTHSGITSLAVLPLENLSGNPEQSYFADGMTDALITEIARAGSMRVVSRTTMLRYKGTRLSTRQIGTELGVDALVEGTILRAGDKVRITAQLIQVSTDNHLWAQSYERDSDEVLRLQQDVANDIARRVGSVVKPVEPLRTVNPEAYGEYLKGRFYFFLYTPEGWQKSIEHYTQATLADASFAPAFAGLAESYIVSWAWNEPLSDESLRKGKAAAEQALQIDPLLASAHLAMGEFHLQQWDQANAEKEFERALELNPNDPLAWQLRGIYVLLKGGYEQGITDQQQALNLDPFSPIINANMVRAYYFSRQYDKAISQAQAALKLTPGDAITTRWLEHAYRHKGMLKEAFAARRSVTKPEELPAMDSAYRTSGYRGVLLALAEAARKRGRLGSAAVNFAQAGEGEQALTLLEECYRHHYAGLLRIKVDPDLDPIRSDPRFKAILHGVGYSE